MNLNYCSTRVEHLEKKKTLETLVELAQRGTGDKLVRDKETKMAKRKLKIRTFEITVEDVK